MLEMERSSVAVRSTGADRPVYPGAEAVVEKGGLQRAPTWGSSLKEFLILIQNNISWFGLTKFLLTPQM